MPRLNTKQVPDPCTIAVDVMGGDQGPSVTLPAAVLALKADPQLILLLVGDQEVIQAHFRTHPLTPSLQTRCIIQHAEQTVTMDDDPLQALRTKRRSSLRLALDAVHTHRAQGMVSAGNTGALMATARYVLGMIDTVDRPALMYRLPTVFNTHGSVNMLDLGANVGCSSAQLVQFAYMGAVVTEHIDGLGNPRIGLLNIGTEDTKGLEPIKEAAALLNQTSLNYQGFVEGHHIFTDVVDVIVCDGFVGNVALKTSEGVAHLMFAALQQAYQANLWRRFLACLSWGVFKAMKKRLSPDQHNGAPLLGLQSVVVKSHGRVSPESFVLAIQEAARQVRAQVPQRIAAALQNAPHNA